MKTSPSDGSPLTATDLQHFKAIGISEYTLRAAGVCRVTHQQAKETCGIRYRSDHLEGIAIPTFDPVHEEHVLAWHVRRDHPEMDSNGKPIAKYVYSQDRRHLYFGLDSYAMLTDTSVQCLIVEAQKSVLAAVTAEVPTNRRHGLNIATGGCWGHRAVIGKTTAADGTRVDEKGLLPDFDKVTWTGRDTIIVFDSNVNTNEQVQRGRRNLATELEKRGAKVRVVDLPVEPGINGPDDYIGKHGPVAFFALVDAAKPLPTTKTKKEKAEKSKQGREVAFEDVEPWPEPVDGAVLLDGISETFSRYLALPTHANQALALWVLHSHTFDAWFASPILAVTSPAPRCGKTLTLIILGAVVPRRLFAANVTPAVLFRTIEKYHPTLLIDEADTFIKDNEELRGVINSGHTRTTAMVIRAVGDDHDPRAFSTWCPKAIALIGKLPATLHDRAIEIRMRRRLAGEHVARLRQDRIEGECEALRRQAARWSTDHLDALTAADPAIPATLHDRAADCWRPLLAMADAAGGRWPELAREAAVALSGAEPEDDAATLLLRDIRDVFTEDGDPVVLASSTILERLIALEDRPWAEWSHGKPMSGAKLARLLKGYGVLAAGTIRIDAAKTAKGYRRAAFTDAWERYLGGDDGGQHPDPPSPGGPKASQRHNANEDGDLLPISKGNKPSSCDALQSVTTPIPTEESDGVTLSAPPEGDSGELPTDRTATRVRV